MGRGAASREALGAWGGFLHRARRPGAAEAKEAFVQLADAQECACCLEVLLGAPLSPGAPVTLECGHTTYCNNEDACPECRQLIATRVSLFGALADVCELLLATPDRHRRWRVDGPSKYRSVASPRLCCPLRKLCAFEPLPGRRNSERRTRVGVSDGSAGGREQRKAWARALAYAGEFVQNSGSPCRYVH